MFARTERLLLRPGWREDAPALFQAIADEGIVRNLARAPWPYAFADAEAFLSRDRAHQAPACLIFLRTRGAPRLIGGTGLAPLPSGALEFGYWIARPYWGLGFATEAGRALIDHARHALRAKRIAAGHFLDNPASGRVLKKLGFKPTGLTAQHYSAGRGREAPCRLFELDLGREKPAECAPQRACAMAA
jgi:RimJ/RimL family protein N-acetyltransferase